MPAPEDNPENPVREIGRWGAISTVAGSMVGVGIFLVPPLVAEKLPTVAGFSSVWVVAALTALAGAISYAELGGHFPRAGGDYLFQHEAYGGAVAFASGWLLFGGIFTGSVAALAVPLCEHQIATIFGAFGVSFTPDAVVPGLGLSHAQVVGIGIVVGITALNSLRVRVSSGVQTLTTFVPIAALTLGGLVILVQGLGSATAGPGASASEGWWYAADWFEAYGRVYFVFSGWNAVIYVAGEVREPGETLPFGLVGGTVLVSAVYAVLCAAFLTALGFGGLAGATEAGTATAMAVGGPAAGTAVAVVVGVAILASINATVLGGARVCYAMAERGAFLEYFAGLNSYGVPVRALWIQAAGASLFIATGTFRQILDLVVLAMMLVGILTVATLWRFRRRSDVDSPFRTPWFPLFPVIYVVSSLAVVAAKIARAAASGSAEDFYPVWGVVGFVAALALGFVWDRLAAAED